jgi:origin recognition complex subunit 5
VTTGDGGLGLSAPPHDHFTRSSRDAFLNSSTHPVHPTMVAVLPLELIDAIARQYPCRESQIEDLATLYNVSTQSQFRTDPPSSHHKGIFPAPRTLVVHGFEQTNKVEVIEGVLKARCLRHVIIKCRECLSQRHLLSKIFTTCLNALGRGESAEQYDRIDSMNALVGGLEKLFRQREERLILVLDGVDKQRGLGPTILPSLARMVDLVSPLASCRRRHH